VGEDGGGAEQREDLAFPLGQCPDASRRTPRPGSGGDRLVRVGGLEQGPRRRRTVIERS
jgi:hypothetical protein